MTSKSIIKLIKIFCITIIRLVVSAYFAFEFLLFWAPFMGKSFSREDWDYQKQTDSCVRGPMLRDLRKNYLTTGRKKEEIIKLLGKEEETLSDKRLTQNEDCIGYTLGMCSGIGMDFDSLYICFDSAEQLTRTFWLQH